MKLIVKNFGPIRTANVDVKPMTVFVGPSNTGKSYLAILIYSIIKVLGDDGDIWENMHYKIRKEMDKGEKSDLAKLQKNQVTLTVKEIEKRFLLWANIFSASWKEQFVYCFGEEGRKMMMNENGKISIVISGSKNQLILDLSSPDNSKLTDEKKLKLCTLINNDLLKIIKDRFDEEEPDERAIFHRHIMQRYYAEILVKHFSTSLLDKEEGISAHTVPHYLPAIRGGIMQSHRTLVSALIERAPMAGLSKVPPIPLFNGVLSDFMQKLINMDVSIADRRFQRRYGFYRKSLYNHDRKKQRKKIDEIGKGIEKKIMGGEINVQMSETRYPDFRYAFESDGKKHDLPLMSVSSMVSELAPVSLFARHHVNCDDLFIVEEPEAHLHPAAQVEISNILVQLVNAGVHVLITTHSDNILEQIGNCILAADIRNAKENKQAKLSSTEIDGQTLNKEKISVYLFNQPRSSKCKNTAVKKIQFDRETGILTEDHLEVSSALYNQTISLLDERDNNDD
ncbi:AAA family ATPase [Candidatus Spongiihabitans sp.]|uniref:AAA family ATPase n=1 Tax=Candidatus Spongiihabitans sp. TaxID=3101308 RepID=UPI003C7BC24E